MRYEMAGMLLSPSITIDKIKHLINKTRAIAEEKDYKGGHFRIHYIAIGRSIKST